MKLGRSRPERLPKKPKLRLADYLCTGSALPTPPTAIDYTPEALASLSDVYLNDQLGDCVIAGFYHCKGLWTGNADGGAPIVVSDDQITADYSAIGGYQPGDPSTDQGCDEVTALDYWHATGDQTGTKIAGYVALDPGDLVELQLGLWLFGAHYYGVELPDGWISPFPSSAGFVWDVAGDPNPDNGHCFIAGGYDATGVTICTWGMLGKMTWAALAKYCAATAGGAVYAILSPDAIAQGQAVAPSGVDWTTLQADLDALGAWPQP